MILTLLTCALVVPTVARAQTATDSAGITSAALDDMEGWYTADAARMERALHPHLAKRYLEMRAEGAQLIDTSALELVQQAVEDRERAVGKPPMTGVETRHVVGCMR